MSPTTPFSTLARALAVGARPGELLPELHRELLAATGGTRSVVLEAVNESGSYVASSGRGLPAGASTFAEDSADRAAKAALNGGDLASLGSIWLDDGEASRFADRASRGPAIIDLTGFPALASHLGAGHGLIAPVSFTRRPTIVVVARPAVPEDVAIAAGSRASIEFGIALEWSRLSREGSFHHRLRELSLVFSRGITSSAGLLPALETVTHEANVLLGTDRTSVWLHDRRARDLHLAASSDPFHAATAERVNVDETSAPARGLRVERPQRIADNDRVLVAPLRGWRRALGTLVVEGEPAGIDREQLVDLTWELARQISAGIENVQLIEEIIRQRRLLEDSFNSLADLVAVTDRALRVVQMNDTLIERIGRPRAEIFEQDLSTVVGPSIASWVAEADVDHARTDASAAPEGQVRTRTFDDGPVDGVFAVTVTPLMNEDEERTGFVIVARDITVQSILEAEREALRARLAQSEKLAALGQFVAGIAHEMNNPLQGIMGHLELLIDHSEPARPVRRELRRIYQEADRTSRIVRNLLVFSGSRRMARRKVRVDRVVRRAVASRRATLARANIEVIQHTSGVLPMISGDPLLLQQAFLNIVINAEHAIESSGSGGRIEITTFVAGGDVVTTVRDTGPGIPKESLPRIFDPFFTTKDVGKGTGLGLAIAYGIVTEHEGGIQVANAAGGGAVFTITVPAVG